jgi:putative NIF3 family GTP cyclohydrolase 1 type 2
LNFQKQSKLNPQKLEALHVLLFQSPLKHKVDSKKIKRKLDLPTVQADKIFMDLIKENVITIEPIYCPECGENIKNFASQCGSCSTEIDTNEYHTNIDKLIDNVNANLIKSKHIESKKAEIIAREWEEQKYISYVLIDLVDSENVQNTLGDQDYKDFFEEIREIIKFHTLSNIKGEYLILGEIGDCIKIAFTKKDDVLIFFTHFSKELNSRQVTSTVIKNNISKLDYFPNFSGIVDILPLPSTSSGNISARSIISITLDGSIDFNSKALTGLFRLDSGAGVNNNITFKNNNVSLWLTEEFIENTEYQSLKQIEIEVGKHDSLKIQRKVSLLLFDNGVGCKAENLEKYIRV